MRPLCFVVALLLTTLMPMHAMTSPTTRPATPLIVAHRGASFDAPENTLAAFKLGWEQNADAIEGDFHLTKDGHIVCIHDASLKRTAGIDRAVVSMTLEEVRQADVGTWKDAKFAGEPIPTLQEVLAIVPSDKLVLVEVKCGPEIIPALKKDIASSGLKPSQVRIIAFNAEVIAAAKRELPEINAFWLTDFKKDETTGTLRPTLDEVLATLTRIRADGLDARGNKAVIDADFVNAIRANGYEMHLWTIDDPDDARFFASLGVDSLTTNKPHVIRSAIAK